MAQITERRKPLSLYSGQVNLSGSAEAIGSSADLVASEVTVKAAVGNAAAVYIGPSGVATGTGFELRAGQQVTVTAGSPDDVYVIGTANDDISWVAS